MAAQTDAGTVTTGSLLHEMVDLRRLALIPEPAFRTVQFSSYDHRSTVPGGPGWFDNSDGFGGEPAPNFEATLREPGEDGVGEYLVCDIKGPGALVRMWTAKITGSIRVYLDGGDTPLFDGTAEDFFRRPYSGFARAVGVDEGIFEKAFYQSYSAYCPIPFSDGCRVVWTGKIGEVHFYHLQARTYDAGTRVQSFKPEDLRTYAPDLQRVAAVLNDPDKAWESNPEGSSHTTTLDVAPGAFEEAFRRDTAGAIERMALRVTADDLDLALRQTILHVICDDYPYGQVQAPVGDFFGAAPGVNPYVSLPFTVHPDGWMISRFPMPFERNVRVMFENLGTQTVTIQCEFNASESPWDAARSMHFRARWRINRGLGGPSGFIQDMPYLFANGSGVYVGTTLHLMNPAPVPSGHGSWWGEGDEKVFVDGDRRPSIFGTGSEDYFNYAWGLPDIFAFPYCAQPRTDGPANRGFVANNRWHILDAIPFKERLAFLMEYFPHDMVEGLDYARIAYHYGRPGLLDDHTLITRDDVRPQHLPDTFTPAARMGCASSVFLEAEALIQDEKVDVRRVEGPLWSGGGHCRWRPKEIGETLRLAFPIKEEGRYGIQVAFALFNTSGRVTVTLDQPAETDAGPEGGINLYRPWRTMSRCYGVGGGDLTKGEHTLYLRYEGGAKDATTGTEIGVDFITVQRLEN